MTPKVIISVIFGSAVDHLRTLDSPFVVCLHAFALLPYCHLLLLLCGCTTVPSGQLRILLFRRREWTISSVQQGVVGLTALLAFHVSAVAVSSIVTLNQAFEAIIVVSAEGGTLVNQHALEGVAILEAVTWIRVADRTFWSSNLSLDPVGQTLRATIVAATGLTIVALLTWDEVRGRLVCVFSGAGEANSTILFCPNGDIDPFVKIS